MKRHIRDALKAWLLIAAVGVPLVIALAVGNALTEPEPAQAGGIIDPAELLKRIEQLESDVRLIGPRLDQQDATIASLSERVEQDHDSAQDTLAKVLAEADRNDIQAARLNGHDDRLDTHLGRLNNDDDRLDLQSGRLATHDLRFDNQASRLDAIPDVARCILPPLAYRHVTVRTAKGKVVVALVPVKTPLGFHEGVYWLARINADCARKLP